MLCINFLCSMLKCAASLLRITSTIEPKIGNYPELRWKQDMLYHDVTKVCGVSCHRQVDYLFNSSSKFTSKRAPDATLLPHDDDVIVVCIINTCHFCSIPRDSSSSGKGSVSPLWDASVVIHLPSQVDNTGFISNFTHTSTVNEYRGPTKLLLGELLYCIFAKWWWIKVSSITRLVPGL